MDSCINHFMLDIRACSGMESTLEMARQGRPFLMNLQSDQTTQERLDGFRQTMADSGYDDQTIVRTVGESWAWRNVVVAETDAAAESLGVPAFLSMRAYLADNRKRLNTPEEQAAQAAAMGGAARDSVDHGLIFGSPETVRERLEAVEKTGIGGLIIHFRLGSMSWEATENSLRLFAEQVAPQFFSTAIA